MAQKASMNMPKVGPASNGSITALFDSEDPFRLCSHNQGCGAGWGAAADHEMLREWPSGDLFGLVQNAGMGWSSADVARDPFLILSTQGGLRGADGQPIALGYHTGHWEVGILVQEAAVELKRLGMAHFCGDGVGPVRRADAGDRPA